MNKPLYFIIGCTAFLLGAIGILLPLLPTTCFWLLAAWAFSKSSDRLYQKLLSHKKFGPLYANWQQDKSIPLKVKQLALISISSSMMLSCYLLRGQLTLQAMVISIMLLIATYLVYLPTSPQESVA